MENQAISIVIQGGAVGLCLVSLGIIYKMQNGQRKSFIDALDRNSRAFTDFAVSITKLADAVSFPPRRRNRN